MQSTGKLAGPAGVILGLLVWANGHWHLEIPEWLLTAMALGVYGLMLRRLNKTKATAETAHEIAMGQ